MTDLQSPSLETPPHHLVEFETTGRGGVGNIVRSRSHSRDPDGRSTSRDRISKVWQKITHQRTPQEKDIQEESAISLDENVQG